MGLAHHFFLGHGLRNLQRHHTRRQHPQSLDQVQGGIALQSPRPHAPGLGRRNPQQRQRCQRKQQCDHGMHRCKYRMYQLHGNTSLQSEAHAFTTGTAPA